jgi:photosynthetic reaction center H subunit
MHKNKHNTATDSRLIRLEELKGFKVAEGDQDIRGWAVKTPDGKKIGKVEELIVDPAERRVRYMEIKADGKILGFDNDQHILVPIGAARLQDKGDDVLLERLPAQGLAGVPPYQRGTPITRDYETSLRNYYGAAAVDSSADYYRDDLYSDSGFKRRSATDATNDERSWLPRLGDNEVTVPLVGDQEVVVRRPGTNEEIVIRKTQGTDEARN